MRSDEQAIREMHTTWIDAVNAGDLAHLLTLMADDVVFLNPGRAAVRPGWISGCLLGRPPTTDFTPVKSTGAEPRPKPTESTAKLHF